jgi:hypothetical protein
MESAVENDMINILISGDSTRAIQHIHKLPPVALKIQGSRSQK